jgi:hypothetical protein
MEELYSKTCEQCDKAKHKRKIYYSRRQDHGNRHLDEFYYDEAGIKHCHKEDDGTYYYCYCSNGHSWYEKHINKCLGCSWKSAETQLKWSAKSDNNALDSEGFLVGLYVVSMLLFS